MKDLLIKIKLIENSNLILENITIDDFRLFFNKIVITERTEEVFENIDFFSKKKNFIGQINLNNFEIRKVVKFNGESNSHTKAIGHFHEQDGHLKIDTNIFGSQNFLFFVYGSLVVFFIVNGVDIFSTIQENGLISYLFSTITFLGLLILPYLSVKWSVRNFKQDYEKEFKSIFNQNFT